MSGITKVANKRAVSIADMTDKIMDVANSSNNPILSGFKHTTENLHRGYDYNKRQNKETAVRWDCSEFSAANIQNMVKDMQDYGKKEGIQWKTNFNKVKDAFMTGSSTAWQHPKSEAYFGHVAKGTRQQVMNADLEVGMVIFMKYDRTKSGYNGHVATVVKDPLSGDVMIAESIGGKNRTGVVLREVDSFFNGGLARAKNTRFTVIDPFKADRETLTALENKVDKVRELYLAAEKNYEKEMNSPFRKVGAKRQSKDDFIENQIEDGLKQEQQMQQKYQQKMPVGIAAPTSQSQTQSQSGLIPVSNQDVENKFKFDIKKLLRLQEQPVETQENDNPQNNFKLKLL